MNCAGGLVLKMRVSMGHFADLLHGSEGVGDVLEIGYLGITGEFGELP